jgi:hypothetical protein
VAKLRKRQTSARGRGASAEPAVRIPAEALLDLRVYRLLMTKTADDRLWRVYAAVRRDMDAAFDPREVLRLEQEGLAERNAERRVWLAADPRIDDSAVSETT